MNLGHLGLLVCPETKRPLELREQYVLEGTRVKEGTLADPVSGNTYVIRNFIPRFVPEDNYARSFGIEWGIHERTQYDLHTGFGISGERFKKETGWGTDLRGQVVLEVGSGSGRFTTHALETGATIVSLDYSNAVEANYRSNGGSEDLLLVQASVYDMPFRRASFDKAFCFGVLQHTPDPREAFMAMVRHLKPGGRIAADIYAKNVRQWLLNTKYWIRPFINRSQPQVLYEQTKRYVDFMWPLARLLRRIPAIGHTLNWRLLVADYSAILPQADDATLREWAHLDTFDMLSPVYDHPQTKRAFRDWFQEAGLEQIEVQSGYNGYEGRGRKPRVALDSV
jgi:SAM-dependent methyltransferase